MYDIFLLPDTIYHYSKSVIQTLNLVGESSVAITLDKEYLLTKSPDTVCIERVQPNGSLLENETLIEHIQQIKPQVVVLDNCFWDNTSLNSSLLQSLLQIQVNNSFLLINVIPCAIFNDQHCQPLVKRELAKRVFFPFCLYHQASWATCCNYTTHFYKNAELENDVIRLLQKDSIDADVYRTAFHFFQGIQSLKLRNDMDLFTRFLDKIRLDFPDKHLMNLVLTVHKYFFETTEKLSCKKVPYLSIQGRNRLSERLNQPVLKLIMNNRPLFDNLASFFTPTNTFTRIKTYC